MEINNIIWDTDGEEIADLPDRVTVDTDITPDMAADWLSDKYGFCVESLSVSGLWFETDNYDLTAYFDNIAIMSLGLIDGSVLCHANDPELKADFKEWNSMGDKTINGLNNPDNVLIPGAERVFKDYCRDFVSFIRIQGPEKYNYSFGAKEENPDFFANTRPVVERSL